MRNLIQWNNGGPSADEVALLRASGLNLKAFERASVRLQRGADSSTWHLTYCAQLRAGPKPITVARCPVLELHERELHQGCTAHDQLERPLGTWLQRAVNMAWAITELEELEAAVPPDLERLAALRREHRIIVAGLSELSSGRAGKSTTASGRRPRPEISPLPLTKRRATELEQRFAELFVSAPQNAERSVLRAAIGRSLPELAPLGSLRDAGVPAGLRTVGATTWLWDAWRATLSAGHSEADAEAAVREAAQEEPLRSLIREEPIQIEALLRRWRDDLEDEMNAGASPLLVGLCSEAREKDARVLLAAAPRWRMQAWPEGGIYQLPEIAAALVQASAPSAVLGPARPGCPELAEILAGIWDGTLERATIAYEAAIELADPSVPSPPRAVVRQAPDDDEDQVVEAS